MHDRGRSVVVIGAGVIGLTSALCLRQRGFGVTVLADRFAPQVTSVVAGALWEWPPAVCGRHQDEASLTRAKGWCAASYEVFTDLARDPHSGVYLRPVTFYFKRPVKEDPRQRTKMEELAGKVRGFRHDDALLGENGVNPRLGLCDAYAHLAPMIDTDVYLSWLLGKALRAGCRVVEGKVTGRLVGQEETLARTFGAGVVVNCAGLGARDLGDASVFPVRGALVRVRNDGRAMPRLTQAHCVSNDGAGMDRGFLFVVPRGEKIVVLGGMAEAGEWGLDVGLHNYHVVREMYRRCVEFLPALAAAEVDAAEPVRVGLRPFRQGGVRLERPPGTRLVHNYGHGGSGVTLSWGCALEAADLVEGVLEELPTFEQGHSE
ncbi:MAG TPA: FAD-dependent oxidoreductase [Gemmataceae bacterium]|jgi:D-amino-acid oxidase